LGFAFCSSGPQQLLVAKFLQPSSQENQSGLTIVMLGSTAVHTNLDPTRFVFEQDTGISLVAMLSASPATARERFFDVPRLDDHFMVFRFFENRYRNGGRVNPSTFFIGRGPLKTVTPCFLSKGFMCLAPRSVLNAEYEKSRSNV
jgi:hypothetical protein